MSDSGPTSPAHRSHHHRRDAPTQVPTAIITVSDTRTLETDSGGALVEQMLGAAGQPVTGRRIVPDESEAILAALDQEIIHKTDGTASSVESAEQQIVIERSAKGSLFMPMVIDWHPHHVAAPAEWRKLTITQSREISPPHEAGGYRLRMAEQHLMVYRSLVQPHSPRAVLGQHTLNESLIGKLDHEGDLQPLLIVE